MKLSTLSTLAGGSILSSLSSLSTAAAASHPPPQAHVFVYDPVPASPSLQQPAQVSPEAARLILAQRLGLSQYHDIDDQDDGLLAQLNAYGGRRAFFGAPDGRDRTSAHVLVWIEDVQSTAAIIKDPAAYSAEFTIANPPSPSDNDRLIQDLVRQAETLPKKADPLGHIYRAGIEAEVAFQAVKKAGIHNDFLSLVRADKSDEASFAKISEALDLLVQKTSLHKAEGWSVTVVLMPPSSSHGKRAAHPYGSYHAAPAIDVRRESTEALLAPSSSQAADTPQKPNYSDLENFPTIQQNTQSKQSNVESPVLGILPPYFDSLEDCQQRTRNCSGHGECKRPHGRKSAPESPKTDPYGCVCTPDRSKSSVTYWGGPACQKRDISQPFWLFVGTGTLLAFLISAGIGMMYSMGGEELPSVIGAGVSGPTRK